MQLQYHLRLILIFVEGVRNAMDSVPIGRFRRFFTVLAPRRRSGRRPLTTPWRAR